MTDAPVLETTRDLTLPRRAYGHGFPLVRLRLGVKGTNEHGWSTNDPPFEGWDEAVRKPGISGWITERGGNVGLRSGPAPRLEARHPGKRFAYLLDLDWGHLTTPGDHSGILRAYQEVLEFARLRALLLILSVSGDHGYGALFAGSVPYATKAKLLEADGVDLCSFYGVTSTGGGDQKVIPPSRIVPELLDTDEQRARLYRTEYHVVGDWLDDETRWAGQDEALAELATKFGLTAPRESKSSPAGRSEPLAPRTAEESEVLRRLEELPLGRAHLAVLTRLREIGHVHGSGHAEVRWALSAPLALAGAEVELLLDMLGYPAGSRCRVVRGRPLADKAIADPRPFGGERLRKVALYRDLPDACFAGPAYRPVVSASAVERYARGRRSAVRPVIDADLLDRYRGGDP